MPSTSTIPVLPAGPSITGADGRRFTLRPESRAALLAALNARAIVVDVDHASLLEAPHGGASPAAAWLSGFSFDATGMLTATADWTPFGQRLHRDKTYRYLSPALRVDANGAILGLHSVALTNQPNFPSLSLNSSTPSAGRIALCRVTALRTSWSGWTPVEPSQRDANPQGDVAIVATFPPPAAAPRELTKAERTLLWAFPNLKAEDLES